MQDLNHSNEFLRAATLRLMCSFTEPGVVRNLNQALFNCLKDPSDHVRANAVMAIGELYSGNSEAFPGVCEDILKLGLNVKHTCIYIIF